MEFTLNSGLEFNGRKLLEISYQEFERLMFGIDSDLEVEVDGCTSYKLGIGAYAPRKTDDPKSPAATVIIFGEGYYD
ncbi:hypothetical protein M9194_13960 [Vibrio sp. S4M6]|uniref:hypothetical protein n=1 Tax=Vibrio sinus TaxID=2946865 RepID=UPI00202A0386|nr:hypothetical protein [Vibrio sinus]MCL9782536.1 hypothetical protein [Vibrio sinus]